MDDFKLLPGATDTRYSFNKRDKKRFAEEKEKRIKKKHKFKMAIFSMVVLVFIISTVLICLLRLGKEGGKNIKKYDEKYHIELENN